VAIGGNFDIENLIEAYRHGIFPWPDPQFPLPVWASPRQRAILEFSELHVPKSLEKLAKKRPFQFSFNKEFDQVIAKCAEMPRPGQRGTWIVPDMIAAYKQFHKLGYAHSIEAWNKNKLVGGLYGVCVDGIFAGESMFHLEPNASKLALLFLVEQLKSRGATWIDVQVLTPHLEALGAKTIAQDLFLKKLKKTQELNLKLF
jgi:leucyl/phenylalanyl-tRNA--protein transferase